MRMSEKFKIKATIGNDRTCTSFIANAFAALGGDDKLKLRPHLFQAFDASEIVLLFPILIG